MFTPWPSLASFARTENGLFYYDAPPQGRQKHTVILIHGLGDEADSWRHLIPLLCAADCRVLAPDLPGFGRSDGRGNFRRHREAVLRLLDGTESAEPVTLAGHSMGAIIAEAAALERPHLVRGLVLLDGCLPAGAPSLPLFLLAMPFAGKHWYRSFRTNHEGLWRSLVPYYADLNALPEEDRIFLRSRVIDRVTSPSQERSYFATLRSMLWTWQFGSSALGKRIASWPGKIRLVWGEHDRILPKDRAAAFCRLRKDARLDVINGSGHLPHQENVKKTAEAILAFLPELEG